MQNFNSKISFGDNNEISLSKFKVGIKRDDCSTEFEMSLFSKVDTNQNGLLEDTEYATLMGYDKNHDGVLQLSETASFSSSRKIGNYLSAHVKDKSQISEDLVSRLESYANFDSSILYEERMPNKPSFIIKQEIAAGILTGEDIPEEEINPENDEYFTVEEYQLALRTYDENESKRRENVASFAKLSSEVRRTMSDLGLSTSDLMKIDEIAQAEYRAYTSSSQNPEQKSLTTNNSSTGKIDRKIPKGWYPAGNDNNGLKNLTVNEINNNKGDKSAAQYVTDKFIESYSEFKKGGAYELNSVQQNNLLGWIIKKNPSVFEKNGDLKQGVKNLDKLDVPSIDWVKTNILGNKPAGGVSPAGSAMPVAGASANVNISEITKIDTNNLDSLDSSASTVVYRPKVTTSSGGKRNVDKNTTDIVNNLMKPIINDVTQRIYDKKISELGSEPKEKSKKRELWLKAQEEAKSDPEVTKIYKKLLNDILDLNEGVFDNAGNIIGNPKDACIKIPNWIQQYGKEEYNKNGDTSYYGYNQELGEQLAQVASENARSNRFGKTGWCARNVMDIISAVYGKDKSDSLRVAGAYQAADKLAQDKDFKEIGKDQVVNKIQALINSGKEEQKAVDEILYSLPAGCIIVYGKKAAGFNKDKSYDDAMGHISITSGNGKNDFASSDYTQNYAGNNNAPITLSDLKNGNVRIFMPVKA